MPVVALRHGDAVAVAQAFENRLRFTKRFAGAFNRKEVEYGGGDHDWPWIQEQQKTRVIDAPRNNSGEILLGIAVGIHKNAGCHAPWQRGDVTRRHRHFDARIKGRDQRGLRAAAARARNADSFRIYVRSRQEIVHRPHAIPNFPAREICSREIGKVAHHGMFPANQVVPALARLRIPKLAAFPLPNRVPRNDNVPSTRQTLTQSLIVNLSISRVARGD